MSSTIEYCCVRCLRTTSAVSKVRVPSSDEYHICSQVQRLLRSWQGLRFEGHHQSFILQIQQTFTCFIIIFIRVQVLNREFQEICSVRSDLQSILFMIFNPVRDELITGGVAGTKIWSYRQVTDNMWTEIKHMANYRLFLK